MVSNETNERIWMKINYPVRGKVKILIIKLSLGLLTSAVIGGIVKSEIKVIDEIEERYFPEKNEDEDIDNS